MILRKCILTGILLAWTLGLSAQIQVELAMDQDQFLPGESLMVAVRITNLSGQDLTLGRNEDWLRFNLEARDGLPIAKKHDIIVLGEFKVPSSEVATKVVDLSRCYSLTMPGKYRLTGVVFIPEWKQEFASHAKVFDVFTGSKLWQQEFGVPSAAGQTVDGRPEVRKYSLQKAIYLRQLRLYLRLTNPEETLVFRVFSLGTMVSFSRPEAQIDRESNLHVLCQAGAKTFFYCMVDPNGQILKHQTHSYVGTTRPVLRATDDGNIQVFGGMRLFKSDDFPPSLTNQEETNNVPELIDQAKTAPKSDTKAKKSKTSDKKKKTKSAD
jgi:hypothetical protein